MNFSFLNIFALGANPKTHSIFDNTDYASQGIVSANVSGLLQLTGPAGAYYSNPGYINDDFSAPDIAPPGTNPGDEKVVNLPLNNSNEVELGTYTLDYKIKVAAQLITRGIVSVNTSTNTVGVTGNVMSEIAIAIGGTLDIIGSTGNNGTYTIIGSSYNSTLNQTIITLQQVLPSAVVNGSITYTNDKYYQATQVALVFNSEEPCAKLEIVSDCNCAKLSSTDVTTYGQWSVVQRTNTLNYPLGSDGNPVVAPVVSSQAQINITDLYTNTYTGQLSVDISYDFGNGFTATSTIFAQKDHKVTCETGLCCTYTCIKSVFLKYLDLRANGSQADANVLWTKVLKLLEYWMLYSIARSCGNATDATRWLNDIKALLEQECDCGCDDCDDGETTQVIPLCGVSGGSGNSQIYDVVACQGNSLITVTSNTVNDTTTFTVCVNTTNLTNFIEGIIANTSIGDLSDVTLTSPVDGNVLVWNAISQTFQNTFLNISQLGDVDLSTNPPVTGDVLVWNQSTGLWEVTHMGNIIYNDQTLTSTAADLVDTTLKTFDIPADTLHLDGDEVRFRAGVSLLPKENDFVNLKLMVGSEVIYLQLMSTLSPSGYTMRAKGSELSAGLSYLEGRIIRLSATTVKVLIKSNNMFGFLMLADVNYTNEFTVNQPVVVSDLGANTLNIKITGQNETLAAAGTVNAHHLTVERNPKIIS